jgi:hypothetical protein
MREAGPAGLFACTAVVHLLLAGFALWRITRRTARPAEDRTGFDLASTAQTMVALEPQPPSGADPGASSPPADGLDSRPADDAEGRSPG